MICLISGCHGKCWYHGNCWGNFCGSATTFLLNSSPRGQNGRHFADVNFRCIFVNEKFCILITIPALVQIMAWRRPGDKPLSEPTMVSLLMHIWVTWPQWVKAHTLCFTFFICHITLLHEWYPSQHMEIGQHQAGIRTVLERIELVQD